MLPHRARTATPEDAQLTALLGPSAAAARAPALAEALAARPADAALAAEAEDVLVRLLRLEPYRVRLVICLDLSSGGRTVAVHGADARGEERGAFRPWLAERLKRVRARGEETAAAAFAPGMRPMPDTASGRACAALAAAGRPAVLLRTADAPRERWFTADDTVQRMDFAALADQARAVAALVEDVLAAEDLPVGE